MSGATASTGRTGEQLAARYLRGAGYQIIARNYREHFGEIDIIARHGETVVFIEVKTRRSGRFGSPFESVTLSKQAQICRTALAYLSRNGLLEAESRFDVIGIELHDDQPDIMHICNAFESL